MIFAAVAAGAGAAATLALGGRLDPRLDTLAHFAPLYVLAALAAGGGAFLVRPCRRAIALGAAVAILAGGALTLPEFRRSTGLQAPPDAPGQVKVIQINALRDNADIARVADWLIAQHPDIVTITEARKDLRDLLVRRARWRTAGAQGSLMIFTAARYVRMDRPNPTGRDFTFVNATYVYAGEPIEVVTIHRNRHMNTVPVEPISGLEQVAAHLPRKRMIFTGDFNLTPWSAAMRRLDHGLGLTRRDRAVATWPAQVLGHRWPLPFLPIDHIYAGPGWATVKVERGPWLGSDHYPLIVTLAPVPPR